MSQEEKKTKKEEQGRATRERGHIEPEMGTEERHAELTDSDRKCF